LICLTSEERWLYQIEQQPVPKGKTEAAAKAAAKAAANAAAKAIAKPKKSKTKATASDAWPHSSLRPSTAYLLLRLAWEAIDVMQTEGAEAHAAGEHVGEHEQYQQQPEHALHGQIVLDPLCGAGTIPLLAPIAVAAAAAAAGAAKAKRALSSTQTTTADRQAVSTPMAPTAVSTPTVVSLGGELSANAISAAHSRGMGRVSSRTAAGGESSMESAQEAAAAGKACDSRSVDGRVLEWCRWDAMALPLRESTVDVVVTDLPFGKYFVNRKVCHPVVRDCNTLHPPPPAFLLPSRFPSLPFITHNLPHRDSP
jgi:hypothetical protein